MTTTTGSQICILLLILLFKKNMFLSLLEMIGNVKKKSDYKWTQELLTLLVIAYNYIYQQYIV